VVLVGRDGVGTPKPGTFGRVVGVLRPAGGEVGQIFGADLVIDEHKAIGGAGWLLRFFLGLRVERRPVIRRSAASGQRVPIQLEPPVALDTGRRQGAGEEEDREPDDREQRQQQQPTPAGTAPYTTYHPSPPPARQEALSAKEPHEIPSSGRLR